MSNAVSRFKHQMHAGLNDPVLLVGRLLLLERKQRQEQADTDKQKRQCRADLQKTSDPTFLFALSELIEAKDGFSKLQAQTQPGPSTSPPPAPGRYRR